MALKFHHVGCLVENIPAALCAYTGTSLDTKNGAPIAVSRQKVQVCFLAQGNDTFIELVEPAPENVFLLRLLRKGISYYHVGYLCDDLENEVKRFVAAGAHELTRFPSEAFEGRCCVFLVTAQQQMIELIASS